MLWGGWVEPWDLLLPSTFSSSNLLPPPSYSSQLLLPPPKPPPNTSYLLPEGLRWLIISYMKRFQCYSAQKSFMMGGGDIAIIATSSRSRSLIRDLRQTLDLDPSLTIPHHQISPIAFSDWLIFTIDTSRPINPTQEKFLFEQWRLSTISYLLIFFLYLGNPGFNLIWIIIIITDSGNWQVTETIIE